MRRKTVTRAVAVSIVTMILALIILGVDFLRAVTIDRDLPEIGVSYGTRLLVVAPHCDDETLAAAGLINRVLHKGGTVGIVFLTNGDGFTWAVRRNFLTRRPRPGDFIRLGYARQKESLAAAVAMGVPRRNIFFLGYPDGGLLALWARYWQADNPYNNPHTGTTYTPYTSSYRRGAPYAGSCLAEDLAAIIDGFKPTTIVYPHPGDHHRDHWAAHAFVRYALAGSSGGSPREMLYLIHSRTWPVPYGYHPSFFLNPPASLKDDSTAWEKLTLTVQSTQAKRREIRLYKTQIMVMGGFLLSFDRRNELFGEWPAIPLDLDSRGGAPATVAVRDWEEGIRWWHRNASSDIESITVGCDGHDLRISLNTKGKLSPECLYDLDVTVFGRQGPPVRLSVRKAEDGSRLVWIQGTGLPAGGEAAVASHALILRLPLEAWPGIDRLMLSGRTATNDRETDRTPWVVIQPRMVAL